MSKFGSPYATIQAKTADYTVVPGDDVISVAPAAATTITLYTPIGNWPEGSQDVGRVRIIKTNANKFPVTVAAAAGSIIGPTAIYQQYQSIEYVADGFGNWYAFSPVQSSFETQISLAAADIIAMRATPIALVPAPGAGKIVVVEHITLKMVRTATQFANGGAVEYRYTDGSGAKVTADMSASLVTGAAGTAYAGCAGVVTELTPVANAAVVITNATAAFDTGTGTGQVTVRFHIETP